MNFQCSWWCARYSIGTVSEVLCLVDKMYIYISVYWSKPGRIYLFNYSLKHSEASMTEGILTMLAWNLHVQQLAQQQACIAYSIYHLAYEQTQGKPNPPVVSRMWPWLILATLYIHACQVIVTVIQVSVVVPLVASATSVEHCKLPLLVGWLKSVVYENVLMFFDF